LIDAIGGLDDAIEAAATLASIQGEYGLVRIPTTRTFWDSLMEDFATAALDPQPDFSSLVALIPGGEDTLRSVRALSRALEPTGVAAMLDYTVEIR
jgi:ClpP class serine protease